MNVTVHFSKVCGNKIAVSGFKTDLTKDTLRSVNFSKDTRL